MDESSNTTQGRSSEEERKLVSHSGTSFRDPKVINMKITNLQQNLSVVNNIQRNESTCRH